jgi:hypothetical protein
MATNRFRKTNFMQPTRKLHMHSGGLNFFLSGERVRFLRFLGILVFPPCFHYIVLTKFPMAPNDVLSVFPNLLPIAPHFIPYFFAQIFTCLNYIARPKEKGYFKRVLFCELL